MAKQIFVVEYSATIQGEFFISADSQEEAEREAKNQSPTSITSWDNMDCVKEPQITVSHVASKEEIDYRAKRVQRNEAARKYKQ